MNCAASVADDGSWGISPNGQFDAYALEQLNKIREEVGFPLPVTSGYRCTNHPIEADKRRAGRPVGAHTTGKAVDIGVSGKDAHRLCAVAIINDVPRVGVNQKDLPDLYTLIGIYPDLTPPSGHTRRLSCTTSK